jgi:hypothetical protein
MFWKDGCRLLTYHGARLRWSRTTLGVVAGDVVPDDHDALGVEAERRGAFHRCTDRVAGPADAGDLSGVFDATSMAQRPA